MRRGYRRRVTRRTAVSLLLVTGGLALVTLVPSLATAQGACGPGSRPEPGLQGRVPDATAEGYRCNVEVVGRRTT